MLTVPKKSVSRFASGHTAVRIERRPKRRLRTAVALAGTLALTLMVPVLSANTAATRAVGGADKSDPVVPQSLLDAAAAQPGAAFRVVVQGARGTRSAAVEIDDRRLDRMQPIAQELRRSRRLAEDGRATIEDRFERHQVELIIA